MTSKVRLYLATIEAYKTIKTRYEELHESCVDLLVMMSSLEEDNEKRYKTMTPEEVDTVRKLTIVRDI